MLTKYTLGRKEVGVSHRCWPQLGYRDKREPKTNSARHESFRGPMTPLLLQGRPEQFAQFTTPLSYGTLSRKEKRIHNPFPRESNGPLNTLVKPPWKALKKEP